MTIHSAHKQPIQGISQLSIPYRAILTLAVDFWDGDLNAFNTGSQYWNLAGLAGGWFKKLGIIR